MPYERNRKVLGGDRGAVQVRTVLVIAFLAIAAFLGVKFIPVYVHQLQLQHDIDELVRAAAIRNTQKEKIDKQIQDLEKSYDLKEGSITLESKGQNSVEVSVNYTVPIELFVTTYQWQHTYKAHEEF